MEEWTIYHNPQCSKSREALAFLKERGITPKVIDYLKQPLAEADLRSLMIILIGPLSQMVRVKEDAYRELNFDLSSEDEIAKNLAQHPRLLERPVIVKNGKAVVARPLEKIQDLL